MLLCLVMSGTVFVGCSFPYNVTLNNTGSHSYSSIRVHETKVLNRYYSIYSDEDLGVVSPHETGHKVQVDPGYSLQLYIPYVWSIEYEVKSNMTIDIP